VFSSVYSVILRIAGRTRARFIRHATFDYALTNIYK